MTPEELQQLENAAFLRIKFASVRGDGSIASDALEEYAPFFRDLPIESAGWTEAPQTLTVQTRHEYERTAHILRHGNVECAAVEHETGLELLVSGIAINIASAAIIGFVHWGWTKWKDLRIAQGPPGKVEPSLLLEGVRRRDADGAPGEIIRLERRGPLSGDSVGRQVEEFITGLQREPAGEARLADGHRWKVAATCLLLSAAAAGSLYVLWWLMQHEGIPPPSQPQPWAPKAVVAALGGLVGGVARALYFFSFDAYAFGHRLRTGVSSKWAQTICKDSLDDTFDPAWVWYLWCVKPVVGAMAGLVFGLAIEFGLVSLASGESTDMYFRLFILGGLSGFFSDGIFIRLRSELERRSART